MPLMSTSSLLVATLVLLDHPSQRNRNTASLLLKRAAEDGQLTDAEREACAALADGLDDAYARAAHAAQPARHSAFGVRS